MERNPRIKCGYCGWVIIGSCASIEQHKCFEHYKEDVHLLQIDENHVARMIPRYGHKNSENILADVAVIPVEDDSETKLDDNADETLIELVFQRPALWNYKLPVQDRTNLKKDAFWLEVSNGMGGGNATIKWVKNRWKDLRDAYVKARKKTKAYVSSGSDTATAKKLRKTSFRFFERMQFLEVTLATETTISSLPSQSTSSMPHFNSLSDSSCSESINSDVDLIKTSHQIISSKITANEPLSASLLSNTVTALTPQANSSGASKNKRKRLNSTKQNDIEECLLKSLRQPLNQPDAIDGILLTLGEGLRNLPYRERRLLEVKWLRELMEVEERCTCKRVRASIGVRTTVCFVMYGSMMFNSFSNVSNVIRK